MKRSDEIDIIIILTIVTKEYKIKVDMHTFSGTLCETCDEWTVQNFSINNL